jgi:hypothetical protein
LIEPLDLDQLARHFPDAGLAFWAHVGSSPSILVAPRLPGLASFIALDPHAAGGGGRGRRSSIRRRMLANSERGTATSASWNTT